MPEPSPCGISTVSPVKICNLLGVDSIQIWDRFVLRLWLVAWPALNQVSVRNELLESSQDLFSKGSALEFQWIGTGSDIAEQTGFPPTSDSIDCRLLDDESQDIINAIAEDRKMSETDHALKKRSTHPEG